MPVHDDTSKITDLPHVETKRGNWDNACDGSDLSTRHGTIHSSEILGPSDRPAEPSASRSASKIRPSWGRNRKKNARFSPTSLPFFRTQPVDSNSSRNRLKVSVNRMIPDHQYCSFLTFLLLKISLVIRNIKSADYCFKPRAKLGWQVPAGANYRKSLDLKTLAQKKNAESKSGSCAAYVVSLFYRILSALIRGAKRQVMYSTFHPIVLNTWVLKVCPLLATTYSSSSGSRAKLLDR